MHTLIGNWFFRLVLALALVFPGIDPKPAPQTARLALITPTACPAGGCAAGQRLTVRAEFDLSTYDTADEPNVRICLYAADSLQAGSFQPESVGEVSGAPYNSSNDACSSSEPSNYSTLGGWITRLTDRWTADSLIFSFRIGREAAANGALLLTVEESAGSSWQRSQQLSLTLPVVPAAAEVFAANDAGTCAGFSPCYVNSGSDLENGFGTGLKDAIDSVTEEGTVYVLGNLMVKSNSVLIDRPLTLAGFNNSSLSYIGNSCDRPLLRVASSAADQSITIRDLTITDGPCANPGRNLLELASNSPVTLEANLLLNGNNAVRVLPPGDESGGLVSIRFNQISGNQAFAILREDDPDSSELDISANNILNNQNGVQVECRGAGQADHNYWGSLAVSAATSNCQVTEAKRLGAPILARSGTPGLDAQLVTVTTAKTYAFNQQIAFQHSTSAPDYPLYVVNHGRLSPTTSPFGTASHLISCSNYWDVFLPEGEVPQGTLDLFFKYAEEPSCLAAIELSTEFCANSDSTRYPLWWYDPSGQITSGWDTTGKPTGSGAGSQGGQPTSCNMASNEISVSIDNDGRPNLSSDLKYAPFVVGIPSASITLFTATPNNKQVTIKWRAASEVNVKGYFLQRSTSRDSGYQDITDFIPGKGGEMIAASYEFLDNKGLTNGTTYYYRLKIVSQDLVSTYNSPISVVPNIPTLTPTFTRTASATFQATITRAATSVRTATRTRTPTRTRTSASGGTISTRTPTPNRTTLARTPTVNRTTTRTTPQAGYPGGQATQSGGSPGYPGEGEEQTPNPGGYPGNQTTEPGGYPGGEGEGTLTPAPQGTGEAEAPASQLTSTRSAGGIAGGQPNEPGGDEEPAAPRGALAVGGVILGMLLGVAALGGGGYYLWSRGMLPAFFSFLPPPSPREGPITPPNGDTAPPSPLE